MSISLFDATNKLKVSISTLVNGLALLALDFVFSEAVPNVEQATIIERVLAFYQTLANDAGVLADPNAKLSVDFNVLTADGTVLENVGISFDPSVPNDQQSLILAKLATFSAELAGENSAA